jgi:phospholipase C
MVKVSVLGPHRARQRLRQVRLRVAAVPAHAWPSWFQTDRVRREEDVRSALDERDAILHGFGSGGGGPGPRAGTAAPRLEARGPRRCRMGLAPAAARPGGPIQHLIVLMMENRSFDHYLGALALPEEGRADVEGLCQPPPTVPDRAGCPVAAWAMDGAAPDFCDPPHGWDAAHASWNGGRNDGFVRQYQAAHPGADPRTVMGYYTRRTLPVHYALADRFTVCDHWFGSVLSSTWPNRKYLHSGRRDDDRDTQTLPLPPGFRTRPIYGAIEDARGPDGRRLTWRSYFCDLPFLAFWYVFAADHVDCLHPITRFVSDCQQDQLPDVCLIDPPFSLADDHPPLDPRLGQKFVGLIVDALTHSESWASSALLILYDENGGFHDHVPPPPSFEQPPADDPVLGFRVPALVVSPWARRRHVAKTAFDHTSVCKSIHTRWGVDFPADRFGPRWQAAPDIWADCFDFTAEPLPMGAYAGPPRPDPDWTADIHRRLARPGEGFEAMLERVFILPELRALDRRATVLEQLSALEGGVLSRRRLVGTA